MTLSNAHAQAHCLLRRQSRVPAKQRRGRDMATKENGAPLRIVIGQRGWVWVGRYAQEGEQVTLSEAECIRRWGTSKGLGELAAEGPRPNTVLDPAGTVRLHVLAIVATLDCNEDSWSR